MKIMTLSTHRHMAAMAMPRPLAPKHASCASWNVTYGTGIGRSFVTNLTGRPQEVCS